MSRLWRLLLCAALACGLSSAASVLPGGLALAQGLLQLAGSADVDSLTVSYGGKAVKNNETLPQDAVEEAPTLAIGGRSLHTLIAVDPDAPSPQKPEWRYFLHWLLVNIPGSNVGKADLIKAYKPPAPPKGTHRYIFLLYRQSGNVTARAPASRKGFSPRAFAKEHRLGPPVAYMWYTVSAAEEQ